MKKIMIHSYLDKRDTVHNAAYYSIAYYTIGKLNSAWDISEPILKRLWKILWPYKNHSYSWGNSEGLTLSLAKIFPFLKPVKKGLNGDQCFPMLIYLAIVKNYLYTNKFLLGMFLRSLVVCVPTIMILEIRWAFWLPLLLVTTWYPNGEFLILKAHHLAPVARLYKVKPLYWILDIWAYISFKITLKKSIWEETTNKIKIFPYLLLAKKQPTVWTNLIKKDIKKTHEYKRLKENWFKTVYAEYFKGKLICDLIRFDQVEL